MTYRVYQSVEAVEAGEASDAKVDLAARIKSVSLTGTTFTLTHQGTSTDVTTPLVGAFNVENILAALGAGLTLGMSKDAMLREVKSFRGVPGRFDPVRSPKGWTAIVDYAHTPDALQQTLAAVRKLVPEGSGRIITVFGCGGNRDKSKRPLMGGIAALGSDITVVTSDNPRDEDPERIIDDILAEAGPSSAILRESDRKAAIELALERAAKGDVVLIAGKGHEDYQIVKGKKSPFSDREVVEKYIARG
jgi:UDP-N-acetylmuramoyl-L-alanyl-D-glutamate--2,6-diaminopimelate ligase